MHPLQTLKVTLIKVVICFCTKRASCFLQLNENQEKLRVVKNTLAAETLALEHALGMFYDQIVYFQIDYIYSTKTLTEKRLQIDIFIVCEMIAEKEVNSVEWCKSELYEIAKCTQR